ncbi:MAG: DUF5666 domain-containing protein [Solirubrobacterales bacterium]
MLSKRVSILLATTAMAATMMLGALAIQAQAALRHIDGTVVSKNSSNHTFRLTTQSGNQVRIKVTSSTVFQRISGFGGLHNGLRVEVEAKTTSNGLVATHVETPGGGGGNGGADDNGGNHGGGGADDGPNHA